MRKTVHFLGGLIFVALLFVGYSAKSQLFYNNGASVTAKEGAIVFVDGIVQNQTGQIEVEENTGNNAEFIIQDNFVNNSTAGGNGFYRVLGDWINNNIFNAGTGTVFLEGGNQLLDGSVSTTFNNLTLDGTGLKTQTIDQFCVGILDLKNLELQNETYGFFVQNTDVNAIIRTSGFVSALNGGFLSRQTNSAAVYLFPVGSSVGTLRYRPVELTPDNATANTYTVRMANVDATTETFDRSNIESGICEINPLFYHQIDRSAGTAGIDLSIFYDESTDGTWDGISNWTSVPQWDIVSGSTTINGVPLDEAYVNAWNDFSQIPYGLYTILPDPSITDPGSFCENDAATDLNAATAGGTWSGTGIIDATNGTFDPTSVTPGTYTITYDVGTGSCTDSDQIDITVNPIPDATITDPGDFCSDDVVFDLTAATAGGTWSGTGITNATNGTFDPSTANIGVNNITYQVTVSGCVGTDNISIQVNALPNVNTGADFDVCEGDNINLSETGGDATSWTWTGPGTFSPDATTQNPSITNATPANSGTYAVEVQDLNGCIASDDVFVTVNANPTTPVVTTDCSGGADAGTIDVTSPVGANYEYSLNGGTYQSGTSFGPLANGTYNLTVLDTNTGCTATLTSIDLNCGCADPTTLTLSSNSGNTCGINPVDVNGNTFGGSATEVNLVHDGTGTLNHSNFTSSPFDFTYTPAAGDAGNTVTITITTDNPSGAPCTSTNETFTLSVNPIPLVNASSNSPVCEGENLELYETGGDANNWIWDGPASFESTNQNPIISGATLSDGGTYNVTITDLNGCTNTGNVVVTVNATPDATITDPGDFCSTDAALDLTAATAGGTWSGTGITDATNGTFDPSAASIGTNTITYDVTSSGCSASDQIDIEVFNTPDASITNPGDFCSDDVAVDLTAATSGGTWSGTGITDATNGTFDPTSVTPGTYTITYDVESGSCTDSDQIDITVNATPDATITDPGDFCSTDAALDLTAATAGGIWSGTGITNTTNGTFDPSTANIGTNTITYDVTSSGCSASDQIDIEVFDTPDASITDPGDFCSDDAAMNLTAVTVGGTWSGTGITDATNGTFDPTSVTPGTYTITYDVGTGSCTDSDQIDITVNATPDATITDPGDFCSTDAAFDLTAATAGGTWSGTGITNTTNGTFDPSTASIGTNTITYDVTSGGCSASDQIDIEVFDTPDASITDPGDFCSNDAAMDLTAASTGGTWSGTGIIDATNGTFDPTSVTPGTYTITYDVGTGSCTDSDQIDITVNATPDATITNPGDFCSDDAAFDLTAATAGGTWSGTGITDVTNGTFDPSTANIGANNITYEVTISGCTGTDNITINIAETPDATITDPGIICITDAVFNLDAVTSGGLWAGDGITDNSAGTFDPSVAGVGVHLITYQVNNGSCDDSDQINIEVIDTPDASITSVGPFCQNDPAVNLEAATPGGTWTGTGITDENSGTFNPSQANIGDNVITYTVSIGACSASSQTTIQVLESGDASITPVGPFCYDEFTVQLEVDNYGGNWEGAHVDNNGLFNVGTARAGTHTVVYTISGVCGGSDTINIVVYPANFVVEYSIQNPSCFGGDNASVEFAVLGGTPPYTYSWSTASSDTSYIDGLTAGVYQFTISDVNGCEVNVETINMFDGSRDCLRIPNAFTPNDDGINDNFIIENLEFYPDSWLQIFNRWGQLLFEAGPNEEPWDGTYNGNPVPTGSYIYVLSLQSELDDVVGIVTIVR